MTNVIPNSPLLVQLKSQFAARFLGTAGCVEVFISNNYQVYFSNQQTKRIYLPTQILFFLLKWSYIGHVCVLSSVAHWNLSLNKWYYYYYYLMKPVLGHGCTWKLTCTYWATCHLFKSLHSSSDCRVDLGSAMALMLVLGRQQLDSTEQFGCVSSCLKKLKFKL